MLIALIVALFGALIGSFANVVIYRLPRGESVAFPGSHCPNCNHALGALELVPILSWLALRGRCLSCRTPISVRYPLVEGTMAMGFFALALKYPLERYGTTLLPLLALFALLLILSLIDLDTQLLPDVLTFPALGLALLGALVYDPASGLPSVHAALYGAALGAGILVFLNRVGGLLLRRFRDTRERLWPVGMDQVGVAALFGTLGWQVGVAAATLSVLVNLVTRRTLRLPELPLYAFWFVAVVLLSFVYPEPLSALGGSLVAAGSVAVVGAFYWWLRDRGQTEEVLAEEDDEPVAMGFGDVKLAAVLGAMLGWQLLLVGLLLAFILGAVGGVIGKALGRGRVVPFGPYLVLGAFAALFVGTPLLTWYLGLLGF